METRPDVVPVTIALSSLTVEPVRGTAVTELAQTARRTSDRYIIVPGYEVQLNELEFSIPQLRTFI